MPAFIIDNFPMDLHQRITAFAQLGSFLSQFKRSGVKKNDDVLCNSDFFEDGTHLIQQLEHHNGWFSYENVSHAMEQWSALLTVDQLTAWMAGYPLASAKSKTVAIIMAGNIPLVGFHDFLSVLLSGHKIIVKLSSNDALLLPFLTKYLEAIAPGFKNRIQFTKEKLEAYDAVIATGSNNTARYFEYYFGKKPHIIRKNRNSIAILKGDETEAQLTALSEDIFRYYGLGCRSVSKLFVPRGYDFDSFFNAMYAWREIIHQNKYANNYDYNKAVYLMSQFDILENGFMMLKEDPTYGSPISTVFYEYYDDVTMLQEKLDADATQIQCVVSDTFSSHSIPFGQTQNPGLTDYADGVDTIAFLLKI